MNAGAANSFGISAILSPTDQLNGIHFIAKELNILPKLTVGQFELSFFVTSEPPQSLPIETHIIVLGERLGAVHLPNSGDNAKMSPCLGFSQQTDFPKILLLIRDF